MPDPNYHVATVGTEGKYDEYRRVKDEFGAGIDVLYGIVTKPKRTSEVYEIFFDKKKFTVPQAKKWLKDHDHKAKKFEKARETHLAVIREPLFFKETRTEVDAMDEGISVVHGLTADGRELAHAVEFDAKAFTPKSAKAWLKNRGQPVLRFLAANTRTDLGHAEGVEVLRVGKFVDMHGNEVIVTDADLPKIVENFDNRTEDVAMVLGHPKKQKWMTLKSDTPAAGWVSKFYVKGKKLLMDIKDIPLTVARWINSKSFRKISLGMQRTGNGYAVGHVGLLGAAPPAVTGLADFPQVKFKKNDDAIVISVDLAEGGQEVKRSEAIALLKKAGVKAMLYADTVSDELVVALAEQVEGDAEKVAEAEKKAEEAKAAADAEAEAKKKADEEAAAKAKGDEGKTDGEKAVEGAVEEGKKELAAAVAKSKAEALSEERTKRMEVVLSKAVDEGRVSPAEVDGLKAVGVSIIGTTEATVELSGANGKEKVTPFDAHLAGIANRPKLDAFKELAPEIKDEDVLLAGIPTGQEAEAKKLIAEAKVTWKDTVELQAAYPTVDEYVKIHLAGSGIKVKFDEPKKEDKKD